MIGISLAVAAFLNLERDKRARSVERSQEELIELLELLPQKSRERVRDALADAESGSAGKNAVEQALDRVLQPEEAAQNFVCLGYSAFVRELCELGVGVDFTPMQAKDLAGAFLTKLLIVGSARLNPTHNTFEPFWREAERKALESEAERKFRDELRDARQRDQEWRLSEVELRLTTAVGASNPGNAPVPSPSIEHDSAEILPVLKRTPSPKWKAERWVIIENYLLEVVRAGKPEPCRTSVFKFARKNSSDCYAWLRGKRKPSVERAIITICVEEKPHLK